MEQDLLDLYDRASTWTASKVAGASQKLDARTPCDVAAITSGLAPEPLVAAFTMAGPATRPADNAATRNAACAQTLLPCMAASSLCAGWRP